MKAHSTLGIDLGSNSIGWALLDEKDGRVIATGVRVFPEGVDRDQQGGELSKNETRRTKRGVRRQIARRSGRKRKLRDVLIQSGLFPCETDSPQSVLQSNPYELRKRGLDEQLKPEEFGRGLIHLNQRRGFRSNRKSDQAKKNEKSKTLQAISELESRIAESGCRTLGEYLYSITLQGNGPAFEKIRAKHTRREMYEKEFELLWNAQQKYNPQLYNNELRERIHDLIFFQRSMYWLKSTIGKCELEKGQLRCPRADRLAQRFRLWQEINNLRYIDPRTNEEQGLTDEERRELFDQLSNKREGTFVQIRKWLHLYENCSFNYERGERQKLKGLETEYLLSKKEHFGKNWFLFLSDKKDEIIAALLDEKIDDEKIRRKAVTDWGVDEETVERLLDINFPKGYMNYSRKAIEKLLPFMEQGLPLMAKDEEQSALREAGYLRPDQREKPICHFLPKPPDLPNPIVRQALHEAQKLINAIIREYGKPDAIHIELPRDVKRSFRERKEINKDQKKREKKREEAKTEIERYGVRATHETIQRYLLWEEQKRECIYSGNPISIAQLLGGETDVDHILPYSRSLDNSMMNKVVCFRPVNAEKGNKTPREWLEATDPERYDEILQRAKRLPWGKQRKFLQKTVELEDFISRQLNDTAYVSREVTKYVRNLNVDVICSKGQITADLRQLWGLNTVLRDDGRGLKNREDHRHHAVDAIVIALTSRSRLQQLARSRTYHWERPEFPEPWEDFRAEVERKINAIYVSHRVQRKIRGAFHEETIYGPTSTPGEFVYRKPLEQLTPNMINDIRDETIRKLVREHIEKHGVDLANTGSIPASVWKEPLVMPSSGVPIRKVRLIKRDNTIQPIRDQTACVKPGSIHHLCLFEIPSSDGSIKRDAVFVSMIEAAKRAKNHEPIIQRNHPRNPEAKFLFSLSTNEMVLITDKEKEELIRFETAASTSQQMKFRHHTFAGKSSDRRAIITKYPNTLVGKKVSIDLLGRLRWAND
ncbi:MAG: type II CRISPR RNA-guided endonuclease Cas9 [Candidatus Omnitrophota bacterium]|jgi:CRISPR-associated endonuclease Csn1|nr:MAG: type II CRISPR RNA-guided endonuclease Cas9 [Candidatus Omnitrophota bacterium]